MKYAGSALGSTLGSALALPKWYWIHRQIARQCPSLAQPNCVLVVLLFQLSDGMLIE